MSFVSFSSPYSFTPLISLSQKLQPSRDLINHALRRRANAQHRVASAGDLRAARVGDDLGHQAQAERLGLQQLKLLLALDL
jgi:hypothetical protein